MRLVPYLSTTGIRPTSLAALVDTSKQAVGQSLADLEARGLVEYLNDPTDGRARLVRLTRAGVATSKRGLSAIATIEQALADRLGKKILRQTSRGLQAMQPLLEGMRPVRR
jgi:DNA-binding MarR family transcriptional regulator